MGQAPLSVLSGGTILRTERYLADAGNVAVSPAGRTILYGQIDEAGSDLMLVENVQRGCTEWTVVPRRRAGGNADGAESHLLPYVRTNSQHFEIRFQKVLSNSAPGFLTRDVSFRPCWVGART